VWQNLLYIAPSQYNSDESNNNKVFEASVANFLPDGLDESSITIVAVYGPPAPPPSTSRRLAASDETYVNYTITFTSDAVSTEVDSITDELEAAVADGAFTVYMQSTASTEGSALVNADSTIVSFRDVEPVADAVDDDDDGIPNDELGLNVSKTTALTFVLAAVFMLLMTGSMAGFIYVQRLPLSTVDGSKPRLVHISMLSTLMAVMLPLCGAVATMSLVPQYLHYPSSDKDTRQAAFVVAVLIVLVRACVMVVSAYLVQQTFNSGLKDALHPDMVGVKRKSFWLLLLFLMLVSPTNLRFFPFLKTEFCDKSGGYPFMKQFKIALYTQAAVAMASTLLSGVGYLQVETSTIVFGLSVLSVLHALVNVRLQMVLAKLEVNDESRLGSRPDTLFDVESIYNPDTEADTDIDHMMGDGAIRLSVIVPDVIATDAVIADDTSAVEAAVVTISTTTPAPADEHQDGEYKTNVPYAEQNTNLLHEQLKNAAIRPLQYFPLPQLREEINAIIIKLNDGTATEQDNAQLDYLLACLEVNPEHKAEVAEEERLWAEQVRDRAEEWLLETRAFVPPFIVSATEKQLIDECGYSKALAKRLLSKKCLWLVRMQEHDIAKLHFADLSVAYGFQGQRLDLVEMGAIFAVCQSIQFRSDGSREKAK
jgi:hypothetical protein